MKYVLFSKTTFRHWKDGGWSAILSLEIAPFLGDMLLSWGCSIWVSKLNMFWAADSFLKKKNVDFGCFRWLVSSIAN